MKILFQGDSITDVGRVRENIASMGAGYPLLVKSALGYEFPGKYEFVNKGIGGSRIVDVYARIKNCIINLNPDVMSLLIGVNDVWHDFYESPNGVDAEKFYKIYDMLIEELKTALPELKIIILEPFVLKGSATEGNWEIFNDEVKKRAVMSRRIAEKYNLPFIELQKGFDELAKTAPADYWLRDGVHPTPMGHEFIKNEWIKTFKSMKI